MKRKKGKKHRTDLYRERLFKNADQTHFSRSRRLRKGMTEAEHELWERLRKKRTGFKFRRQHPLGPFIVDLYCHEKGLVVEIDGAHHELPDQRDYDEKRRAKLERMGLSVVRFKNEEVLEDPGSVRDEIQRILGWL